MYYILETDDVKEPGAYSAKYDSKRYNWQNTDFKMGIKLDLEIKSPIEVELYEYDVGHNNIPDYWKLPFPIMSDEMISTLKNSGVDNFQTFPVVLRNHKRTLKNYKIINIIGVLDVVDMEKSDYIDMGGTGLIAVSFRNLVVDEKKANGALMFRSAQSLSTLIINEKIKVALDENKIRYTRYIPCVKYDDDIDEEFHVDDYNWD